MEVVEETVLDGRPVGVLYKYGVRSSDLGAGFDERSEDRAIVDEVRKGVVLETLDAKNNQDAGAFRTGKVIIFLLF